jgi:hypothetical protein
MLFPLVVAFVAVSLGAALALSAREGSRAIAAIRIVAILASALVIGTHLLPEAIGKLGLWAFAAFALGVALPALVETVTRRVARGQAEAGSSAMAHAAGVEIAFVGLVVHRFGDGLTMGAVGATSATFLQGGLVILAVSAHIVPVTTLMILAVVAVRSRRSAIAHAGLLAASTMAGVVVAAVAVRNGGADESPWISALVAGLLAHIVVHDLPKRGRHAVHEH